MFAQNPAAINHSEHTGDEQLQDLFRCRQEVARQAAAHACDLPGGNSGDQPFRQASLNIGHYAVSHKSPIMPQAPMIPIAVEPNSDFVSNDIVSIGMFRLSQAELTFSIDMSPLGIQILSMHIGMAWLAHCIAFQSTQCH